MKNSFSAILNLITFLFLLSSRMNSDSNSTVNLLKAQKSIIGLRIVILG